MVSKTNKKNRLCRRRRTRRRTENRQRKMPKPVREIYGRHRPGGNGHKYYVDCSTNVDKLIATQVLSSNKIRTIMSGVKNEGDTHREIIAKVTKMSKKNTNLVEYQYGKLLQDIRGFIRYICLVTCTTHLQNPETVTLPSQICDKEPKPGGKTSTILIMPYYKDGSMEEFAWKESDVAMCKSCLQQIVLSLYHAFKHHGFLHNDLHFNNVLLEKTEESTVTYDDITVPTHGYKICIMDFDNSYVVDFADETKHEYFWYDLRNLFSRFTDLPIIFQLEAYNQITQFVLDGCTKRKSVHACVELLPLIDQLQLDCMRPRYQPYVYKRYNHHN